MRQPGRRHVVRLVVERVCDRLPDPAVGLTKYLTKAITDPLAATVAFDTYADPHLWTPEEIDEPAMYLHRLIVRRPYAGLGTEILDWASAKAATLGKAWVRIDVWTDNTPLHRYYQRNGFQHVRTLDSDYPSGALFQRPANTTDWDGSGRLKEV
ncbi:GNAT family N-acetyltransferase [Actinopolymorpha sp. B11F2]|uniref:GNAT family N-acetyltransferase n=1 Tax=Actinopolymorpha sp. B11F2 TaxID=3160862 RepID=UPI0032E3C481